MTECCPVCGREEPPTIYITGAKRQRFLDCLLQHPNGRTVWQLLDYIYWDDPSGGTDKHNIISVMAKAINVRIASQGWRVRATGGPGSMYRLTRLSDA